MDDLARYPLARAPKRDVQRTFRFSAELDRLLQNGAGACGIIFSEYVRLCLIRGHNMLQVERQSRQIGA